MQICRVDHVIIVLVVGHLQLDDRAVELARSTVPVYPL